MPDEIVSPTSEVVAAYWAEYAAATGTVGEPLGLAFDPDIAVVFERFDLVRPR